MLTGLVTNDSSGTVTAVPVSNVPVSGARSGLSAGKPSDGTVTLAEMGITSGTAFYTCLDCGAHFCREMGTPIAHVCAIAEVCPIDAYEHSKWWAR